MTTATTARTFFLNLIGSYFREVRILVRTQQYLTTGSNRFLTSYIRSVNGILDLTCVHGNGESSFFLNLQEQLPSDISQGIRQYLYIIRTGRRVNDLIQVALFLQ